MEANSFGWVNWVVMIVLAAVLQGYTSRCCLEQEKVALLQLKSHLLSLPTSPDTTEALADDLSSWNGDDGNCCIWNKVTCNGSIQRVTKLSLQGLIDSYPGTYYVLNLTFFQPFQELITLELSYNNLRRLVGYEGLTHLKKLQVLHLSTNYLNGSLNDLGLCKLGKLEELRVEENELSGIIPQCLWNFTSLRVLDLSHNHLSGNLPSLISLPWLQLLYLNDNNLQGTFSLGYLMNHSRLEWLFVSNNALQLDFEESLHPSTFNLKGLGISHCNVNGQYKTFPKFLYHQSNLDYIDLSSNGLVGSFPVWLLQNNSNLIYLSLRSNNLDGGLMLPKHRNLSLRTLDVSSNELQGKIPKDIGVVLSSLEVLNMSRNAFDGQIPASVGNMTQLFTLDLSSNLVGGAPRELFSHCTDLMYLLLSNNNLQGDIIPSYMNLSSLSLLYLDSNNLEGTIQSSLNLSSQLLELDISDNNARGELPSWIGDCQSILSLSLARNQFHGVIPSRICKLQGLMFLDLSENRFSGKIPGCERLSELRFCHMHGNRLTGAIPKALASLSSLVTLDLRDNRLSGGIPQWIGKLSHLVILLLGGNQLQGNLPAQLCQLQAVNIIDLSRNSLSGAIPHCFGNLPFGSKELNVLFTLDLEFAYGHWPDKLSVYIEGNMAISQTGRQEEVEFVAKSRYNFYKGSILSIMSGLDLSCNKLTGVVPPELGELRLLHALNLSHNDLSGSMPKSFSKLESIESLDLSSNNFSGAIPSELVDLTFLEIFNVSYNNLSGQVPETGQFGTFDETNYKGNPLLCGSRLPRSCGVHDKLPIETTTPSAYDKDEGFDMEVFLWSFGVSFAMVLVTFVIVLAINPYWRRAWFAFIDVKFLWWFNP